MAKQAKGKRKPSWGKVFSKRELIAKQLRGEQ